MRPNDYASPDNIDLTTLGASLRRSASKLIALSLVAGALTYIALSLIAPRYTSQAEMAIVAKGTVNPFSAPNPQGNTDIAARMDKEAVNTHVRAIQSPALLESVAAELRLSGRPEFNPVLGPVDTANGLLRTLGLASVQSNLSDEDRVLNEISKRLMVYSPETSRAITINFTSIDPKLAADFANALANNYRERLANASVEETSAVQESLAPRIAKLQNELASAEEAVADFRAKAGLIGGGSQKTPINEQQLGEITTELTKAKSERLAAENRAKNARDLMRRGTPEVIPEVQRSPLIQNLISQRVTVERELLKRSTSLKPAHPVMKQLNADLSAVNRQIAAEVANVVASLDKEAFLAAEQEQSIAASLEKTKSKVAVNNTDEVELRRLSAGANAKRAELERLQAQFEANRARTESGAVPVEAQIINLARPPSIATFPKKLPYTLLAMVATLLLGTAIVITAGLTKGARAPAQTRADLREEIAAAAAAPQLVQPAPSARFNPRGNGHAHAPAVPSLTAVVPPPSDSFERVSEPADLARHLLEASVGSSAGFRTLIASRLRPDETANLALAAAAQLAQTGKQALIIDWSLEGKGIARTINIPSAPGFVELLKGGVTFADVLRWVPGSQVHFIPSGWAFAEGPGGLDADQLNLILDALDEAYDHIFVVGQYESARALFETIQGRFDAGIVAADRGDSSRVLDDPPDTFLGFEVSDIDLIRYESRSEAPHSAA